MDESLAELAGSGNNEILHDPSEDAIRDLIGLGADTPINMALAVSFFLQHIVDNPCDHTNSSNHYHDKPLRMLATLVESIGIEDNFGIYADAEVISYEDELDEIAAAIFQGDVIVRGDESTWQKVIVDGLTQDKEGKKVCLMDFLIGRDDLETIWTNPK